MKKGTPKKFFSKEEEASILSAIRETEQKTSGEIRVHLTRRCKGSAYETAVKVFEKLGMTRTAERNSILIYLALQDHQFAIVGDTGIHKKVSPDFWNKIRDAMEDDFRKGDFVKGLLDGIQMSGQELARDFPRQSGDRNELADQISEE